MVEKDLSSCYVRFFLLLYPGGLSFSAVTSVWPGSCVLKLAFVGRFFGRGNLGSLGFGETEFHKSKGIFVQPLFPFCGGVADKDIYLCSIYVENYK